MVPVARFEQPLAGITHGKSTTRPIRPDKFNKRPTTAGSPEYAIRSSRFNKSAAMTVRTIYRQGEGKSYHVVARSGSAMLQTRVFDQLLQEEAEMSRGETRRRELVNSENYVLRLVGEETRVGRKCFLLELTPRAKSTHLLRGKAWIDQEDGSLVRIEGKPTASPSFLTGRPTVIREYEKVGDFWLAKIFVPGS